MTPSQGDWPSNLTFYVDVDDLATYREKIVAAGGEMVVDEMEVPGVGTLALFKDPDWRAALIAVGAVALGSAPIAVLLSSIYRPEALHLHFMGTVHRSSRSL